MEEPDWLDKHIKHAKVACIIPRGVDGGICFDIGSNVGGFSILNHSRFDKIYAIEPCKDSINRMSKNIKNRSIKNIELINKAVYKESGVKKKLKIYKGSDLSGNLSIIENDLWDDDIFEIVETITLDDIKNICSDIKYMKIDIEGGEYDFLMNNDLDFIENLSIELHLQLGDEKVSELIEHIEKYFVEIHSEGDGIKSHFEKTYVKKK